MMETTVSGATTQAYPLYDTHGNMVATLSKNSAGTSWSLGNERSYDVWGSVRSGATTGGPKGRYVANLGHVQDDESGLIYMRARYYEPESGRFVSEDPAMEYSNWYIYCRNNPIDKVDQNGCSESEEERWRTLGRAGVAILIADILMLGLTALLGSVAAKTMAWTGLIFLAMWFGGGVSSRDGSISIELTNGIIGLVATLAFVGAPLSVGFSAASESPGMSAVEMVGAYVAFISAFIGLTALEEQGVH